MTTTISAGGVKMAAAIKSKNVCPECGGRRWWLCTWGLGEWVDPEANDPIVDLHAAGERMVDFCALCGCGVTSHYWQRAHRFVE